MRVLPLLVGFALPLMVAAIACAQGMPAYQEESQGEEVQIPDANIAPSNVPNMPLAETATKEEPALPPINAVKLQGLNKVTARISTLDPLLGTVERFGNLEIIAHRCWQSALDERPESAALLEIRELRLNEPPITVFQGWMFASSPGLSALEHPVYDITVLACENRALDS